MCGRFALTLPHDAVAEMFDVAPDPSLMMRGPRYNICPTQEVEVCRIGAEMRPRAEKACTSKRKTPAFGEGLSFGRTRRIRTADLYHVKADWPHQDTRGRVID